MSDQSWQETLTGTVRTLQIVVLAMTFGCVMFLVIALAVTAGHGRPPAPVLSYAAAGFAVLALVVRTIVPGIVVVQGRRNILQETAAGEPMETWPNKLMRLMMTKTIAAAAILEGATFFLLVAYITEKTPWVLAMAIAWIILLTLHSPTQSRALAWIGGQLRQLEEDRATGS